jgi:prepilin-type N-terminal cleavage/methylation domain-containing protein
MRRRASADDGMTLLEIVISVAILGIIIGPIGAAMMLGFATNNGTRQRIADSQAAQLLSAYATPDIQSAKWVIGPGAARCGAPNPAFVATHLRLEWRDPAAAADTVVVYEERSGPGDGPELVRVSCGPTGVDESTLVHSLDELAVVCTRSNGTTGCPTAPEGDVAAPVRTVQLDVTVRHPRLDNSVVYEPFEFSIAAMRRVTQVAP